MWFVSFWYCCAFLIVCWFGFVGLLLVCYGVVWFADVVGVMFVAGLFVLVVLIGLVV